MFCAKWYYEGRLERPRHRKESFKGLFITVRLRKKLVGRKEGVRKQGGEMEGKEGRGENGCFSHVTSLDLNQQMLQK